MYTCIKCEKKLKAYGYRHPDDGIHFISYGNYGSTVFDPCNGDTMNIFLCDTCLQGAVDKGVAEIQLRKLTELEERYLFHYPDEDRLRMYLDRGYTVVETEGGKVELVDNRMKYTEGWEQSTSSIFDLLDDSPSEALVKNMNTPAPWEEK